MSTKIALKVQKELLNFLIRRVEGEELGMKPTEWVKNYLNGKRVLSPDEDNEMFEEMSLDASVILYVFSHKDILRNAVMSTRKHSMHALGYVKMSTGEWIQLLEMSMVEIQAYVRRLGELTENDWKSLVSQSKDWVSLHPQEKSKIDYLLSELRGKIVA